MGGACHRLVLSRQEIPPVVDQIKHLIGITSSVCNPITIPESVKCNIKSLRCAEQAEDIKLHPQDLDQTKSNPMKHLIDGVAHNFKARLGSNNDGDVGVGVKAIEIVILVS